MLCETAESRTKNEPVTDQPQFKVQRNTDQKLSRDSRIPPALRITGSNSFKDFCRY